MAGSQTREMEEDRQIVWGFETGTVELKQREGAQQRERDWRGWIQTGYGGQREELRTGDREPDRERWKSRGIALGAGRRRN